MLRKLLRLLIPPSDLDLLWQWSTREARRGAGQHAHIAGRQRHHLFQVGIAIAVVVLLSFLVMFVVRHEDIQWPHIAFERSVQKLHLMQTMSHDLLASAEAEKRALMAETDESSQAFAEQSIQAAHKVEKTRRELEPLLGENRQEAQLFREFSRCWDTLQEIDHEVLVLAG